MEKKKAVSRALAGIAGVHYVAAELSRRVTAYIGRRPMDGQVNVHECVSANRLAKTGWRDPRASTWRKGFSNYRPILQKVVAVNYRDSVAIRISGSNVSVWEFWRPSGTSVPGTLVIP
jgi:hypothetical protein